MSDVFSEIDDDLRDEKLKQFWKENGSWIIGGAIAAVLLTGALTLWRQWDYARNAQATETLTRLVNVSELSQLENFSSNTTKNHAMIARFVAAGKHLERKEKDQALALYNQIADTSGLDKTWRHLAQLLSISLRLDKDPPEKLAEELADLSGDDDTWRYSAWELSALLAAKQGQLQSAIDTLTKITADPLAPEDARTRAFTLRELYMADVKPTDSKS